jgi:hypothetical protein
VCGVLSLSKTPQKRRKLLEKFSFFELKSFGQGVNRNLIAKIALFSSLTVFPGTLVLILINQYLGVKPDNPDMLLKTIVPDGPGTIGFWTLNSFLMHLVGVLSAFVIQKTSINTPEQNGNSGFSYANLMESFLLGFNLNVILLVLMIFPFYEWQIFRESWAWAFVPAITASFTSYFIDDRCMLIKRRLVLSLFQAITTSMAALIVYISIFHEYLININRPIPIELVSFGIYCIVVAFIIGFVLSHAIQGWTCSEASDRKKIGS